MSVVERDRAPSEKQRLWDVFIAAVIGSIVAVIVGLIFSSTTAKWISSNFIGLKSGAIVFSAEPECLGWLETLRVSKRTLHRCRRKIGGRTELHVRSDFAGYNEN
jgi:undecaprenyl pyrophosphate phosphatase UppP